ncbi:prephenate dehydrogenase [Candidatus Pelagibacter communis]|uniref:prephenate dehydrogenase n=1 Tax=Pelagibacter ubique TaxID=198252 RepID=UPI00094C01D7|nr:prephenate dehydrogenase/arogenate dehydrogenase family protein [Candidatus Pelagibacter ubique]
MINKLLIVGCGLIGSSILKKVCKKKIAKKILVFEKSKKNQRALKRFKLKFELIRSMDKKISECDLIIICAPLSEYEKIFLAFNKYSKKNILITDVGSAKKDTITKVNRIKRKDINWISSHPIAGSEVSGPLNGSENLFVNKWSVIIKQKNSKTKEMKKILKFWKLLGSKTVTMDADQHDKIFAITSHLPHLIAYNLILTATNFRISNKNNILRFSAGGLRDFSRIAASNEIMWRDIFFNNKKNMLKVIDLFIKNLKIFKQDIKSNRKNLEVKLKNLKKVRQKIILLKQDTSKPDFGRI